MRIAWRLAIGTAVAIALWSGPAASFPLYAEGTKPAESTPEAGKPPAREIVEIVNNGRKLRNEGDYDAALKQFEEALARSRESKDQAGEAMSLNNIASVYRYQARGNRSAELIEKSAGLYEQAVAVSRQCGDRFDEGYATLYLGYLSAMRGKTDDAIASFEAALPLFRSVDDHYYIARTLTLTGSLVLHNRKQPEKALQLFEEAMPSFREAHAWKEAREAIAEMNAAYELLQANEAAATPD